jgi:3-hydroxyacyl-[acyl-carrier-protein] dehydratase
MTTERKSDETSTPKMLEFAEITKMIPHRYPFLLVDRVKDMVKFQSAVGIKCVKINEPFFPGHFPQKPVMPGVLIVESMAQTAGILVIHSLQAGDEPQKERLVYFMSIENAKFRVPVVPGDCLEIRVNCLQSRRNVWKFRGEAYVGEKMVAEAVYTAMIMDA